jgi:hypothetical protein
MFRDNKDNAMQVAVALRETEARLGVLESMPLAVLAAEACRHIDNQDECSVTVRSSKEHGIQFFYSGCEVHAAMLSMLMSVHQQGVLDRHQLAGVQGKISLEAKILLMRIAQVVDGNNNDLLINIKSPKPKKEG